MRGRTVLALAGGTVTMTAVATRRLRERKAHRGSRRKPAIGAGHSAVRWAALALFGSIPLGIGMPDLDSIFLKFWGLGNLIWDQISSIVLAVLKEAWALLQEAIDAGFWAVDQVFEEVWGFVDWSSDKIRSMSLSMATLATDTWNGVEDAFRNFRQQLQGILDETWGRVMDWVLDNMPDWIKDALGGVWDTLAELADLGWDTLRLLIDFAGGAGASGLSMLLDFMRDPIGFLWALLKDSVDDAIGAAAELFQFSWDAFWGLFWPLLARQLGLPEDPQDMIAAAKWLFSIALDIVRGDLEEALQDTAAGFMSYVEEEVPRQTRFAADFLIALIYKAMGVEVEPGVLQRA